MFATTIWVLFVAQSFAKDLVPNNPQKILSENVDSRTHMDYYDSTNPHHKINFIYEQRKTNEVTEIEQIKEEIGKYMHHHHQPPTTTTEAQQNIEIANEKDIKETTKHSPETETVSPKSVIEKHHHKYEEKEVTSTLAPMPPAPKLREPFITVYPDFSNLPANVQNKLKELLTHELRRTHHRHPVHRLQISRTTSEAPVEVEAQTELSPSVTQWKKLKDIPNNEVPESHLHNWVSRIHEPRPIPQKHPDHRPHISSTASEAPVKEEAQTELSPSVTQWKELKEIPNNDVPESHLYQSHYPAHEPRPINPRHPHHRLHISRTASEAPIEEEVWTEPALPVTEWEELKKILNNDIPESHLDQPDSPDHELRPILQRHPDHQLHISRTASEAPVEVQARLEPSRPVTEWEELEGIPYDVRGSHSDRPESPAHELINQNHPDHQLQISRTTSEAPVEEEAQTELSQYVTQWKELKEIPINGVPESHLDQPDFPAHEPRSANPRHPNHRLHISHTASEVPVEEKSRTELALPVTEWEELKEMLNNDVPESHLDHPDFPVHELKPINQRHPNHGLHISRPTSEAPIENEARTNHAFTDKRMHLSATSHAPSFLSRMDRNALDKIRPKFEDVHHGSIGLPSRPRPVYRGSYKFSWDDINDMHASTVPKVSPLKENRNPPPVPTLSPWYDGYGK